jgi:cell wall-associated NlpC family hydrolase
VTARADTLCSFLGKPWVANAKGPDAYDCWHLAVAVSRELFGRTLPDIAVPVAPSWAWMIDSIERHPERARWQEARVCPAGLVTAEDGAVVLMARREHPAHIGVWLAAERCIIHVDPSFGVVCDSPLDLRTKGWTRLRFYQPI